MAALPYIQLYVAEYLADTQHLNAAQHGAYMLLIFNYWQRGKALANNDARLAITAKMTTKEWAANKEIISEFFEVTEAEWIHHRIDRDLQEVQLKSDTNKANGSKGGRPKKANGYADGLPNGSENETETKGNRTEQIRTDNTPLPPEGVLEPDQVASAVLSDLGISGTELYRNISDVCRSSISSGAYTPDSLRAKMVTSCREYEAAKPRLNYAPGLAKFFGDGLWRDASHWPWKDGCAPAKSAKTKYINDEVTV